MAASLGNGAELAFVAVIRTSGSGDRWSGCAGSAGGPDEDGTDCVPRWCWTRTVLVGGLHGVLLHAAEPKSNNIASAVNPKSATHVSPQGLFLCFVLVAGTADLPRSTNARFSCVASVCCRLGC